MANEKIQDSVREYLKEFEKSDFNISNMIRNAIRTAFQRNDYQNLLWLEYEMMDVRDNIAIFRLGQEFLKHISKKQYSILFYKMSNAYNSERQFINRLDKDKVTICTISVPEIEKRISNIDEEKKKLLSMNYLNPTDLDMQTTNLILLNDEFNSIIERIKQRLYKFLICTEKELTNMPNQKKIKGELYMLYMSEIFGPILATSTVKSVIKFADEKISEYINKKFGNKSSEDIGILKKEIEKLNKKLEAKEEDEITQEDIGEVNNVIVQIKQKQSFISDVIISDSIFQEWCEKNLVIEDQVPIVTRKLEILINNARELKIPEKHRLEIQDIKTAIELDLKEMTDARRKARINRLTKDQEKAKEAEISLRNNITDAGILLKPYYIK